MREMCVCVGGGGELLFDAVVEDDVASEFPYLFVFLYFHARKKEDTSVASKQTPISAGNIPSLVWHEVLFACKGKGVGRCLCIRAVFL